MNFIRRNWQRLAISLHLLVLPTISFAEITTCNPAKQICNPLSKAGVSDLPGLIKVILTAALKLAIPLIALMIIYSGFLFVAARGNPESLKKAKDTLLYTLIGAGVLLGALAIVQLIQSTVTAIGS